MLGSSCRQGQRYRAQAAVVSRERTRADRFAVRARTDYIGAHNAAPKPFYWTAPADTIIVKVKRGAHLSESLHENHSVC